MAFCPNCGSAVEGRFCPKCGTQIGEGAPSQPPSAPAGPSGPPAAATGMQENVASALCYVLGLITGILFLALAPYNQNRNIRFHAFQSIFFNIAWIIFWILISILGFALPWFLSAVVWLLSLVVWLGGFIVWLLLMWRAYQNRPLVLPVVGPMAQQQA